MMGKSEIKIPYVSHNNTPVQNIKYIPKERSLADFDFQVLITCGKKATVVQKPAASPIKVYISIILQNFNVIY
jgi:hypothetical protein